MRVHLRLLFIVIAVKNLVMCFAVGNSAMHFLRGVLSEEQCV